MAKLFGTNGVRGIVGEDMTVELVQRLGRSLGAWTDGPVLVGRDSRTSGPMMEDAFVAGVRASGTDVTTAGLAPTAAVQHGVKEGPYSAGAIITASHNPPEFNGVKIVKEDGTELVDDEVETLEQAYFDRSYEHAGWDDAGTLRRDETLTERYGDAVIKHAGGPLDEEGPTVVVDCANGAGCVVAPRVLQRLGARVISVNAQPDGSFPGHPSEPTPENVASTMQTVEAVGADFGVVLDGDADRCVFITSDGSYVPGSRMLALVAHEKVEENGGGVVVTPVSSSQCVAEHVEAAGGTVKHTRVGSPIVADVMKRERALFGGEENGGLMFPEHLHCRDGTMTAAWMTKHLTEKGASLEALIEEVPVFHLEKMKVDCPNEAKTRVLEAFSASLDDEELDETDGVKVMYEDGWVLVRPSGTEPLIRVYAEAKEKKRARSLAEEGKKRVAAIVDENT